MQPQSSQLFSAFTVGTPPSTAFSPPPGVSPAPSGAPTPRRYVAPSPAPSHSVPPAPKSRASVPPSSLGTNVVQRSGLEDPVIEARKVLARLMGPTTEGGGLIDELERGFQAVLTRWESPFNEAVDAPDVKAMMEQLASLLSLLRSSPIGGLPVPATPFDSEAPLPTLDASPTVVQRLFKERQRARDGADIAGSVLSSVA